MMFLVSKWAIFKSIGIVAEQKHSPDGKKRGGADAASLGGPLMMQIVQILLYTSAFNIP